MHSKRFAVSAALYFGLSFAIKGQLQSFNKKIRKFVSFRYCTILIIFIQILPTAVMAQQQLSQTKAERLYTKGQELIQHENYGAARQIFTQFLEVAAPTDARRSEAQYYVAFSALNLSHSDGEKLIDNFVDHNPSSPRASTAYYDLAIFFYDEKNYGKAVQYFKKVSFPALTTDQQNRGHFAWGYSLFNQKKLDEALDQFNFVKRSNTAYAPAASYYAGFIEYSNGRYAEALEDLKRAETSPSYSSVVPFLIANVYYRQQKYDELLQYANMLQNKADVANKKEISMLVAEAYYFKKDYKKAVDAYETYLAGNPDKGESSLLFKAGYAHYALGQEDKAVTYLKKSAASSDSVSYYASYYLGILYLKQGEKNYAMNAFDYARKYPADKQLAEESAFQFAKVAYDAGKSEQAIDEFEKFLKVYPSSNHDTEVKELLAQAYVNGNNYNKAIEYIEALPRRNLTMDRAYQKATYLKGAQLFNMDNYAEAVKLFEKSLQYPIDEQYVALASFWAGEAYSSGRRYEDASKHYLRLVGMGSTVDAELLLRARYGLGYAYYNTEVYDRALYNFREFVNGTNRSNPKYTDALVRLADCYYVTKSYQQALEQYTKARNIGSPDNDYILLQTGIISGILRNYGEARTQLTTLISSYPKSQYRDEALFQRAQYEIEQGNYQVAAEGLTRLIKEAPGSPFTPYAYMRRAAAYYNLKQYDRTVEDYAHVVRQYPTHALAQQALVPLQEALNLAGRSGEFDSYIASFKRANPDNKGLESLEFETAKNLYFDQQYQRAITNLNTFVTNYPQSARVSEARYYIAESHYRLRQFDKALPLYEDLSKDVTFSLSGKAVARLAEIDFKEGRYEKAINSFRKLEKQANSKKELYNAWSGMMESFYFLNRYDSVETYAKLILERGNVNASSENKATLFLGKAAMAKGDYETAKDEFLNTLNTARDEFGAEAKYLLGEIFYLQKDYKQSYETLISLTKDFGAYEEWVGKAYLLLADNFVAMGDVFQAKATLQSLEGFPLQNIKDAAKAKLKTIEEAQQKQIPTDADTLELDR